MTSTAVKVRQGQQSKVPRQSGWKEVMGVAKIKNATHSFTLVKKLIVTSLSQITYVRNVFDEDAYANKTMDGVKLKILREKSGHEEAQLLSSWIIGAMDAIEKKYLRELVFIIYKDKENPEDIHEKYTFSFAYSEDGEARFQMSSRKDQDKDQPVDMDNVQDMTRTLLRNVLSCTNSLPPLPKSAFMAIKLTYYDEVTPEDYEPEGFTASNLVEKEVDYHLNLGEVDTKYHVLKLKVDAKTETEAKPQVTEAVVKNNYLDSDVSQSQGESQGSQVSCVCGTTTKDPLMLTCAKCGLLSHGACYRVLSEDQVSSHYCVKCHDTQHPCTDSKLAANPHAMTCVFRRLVAMLRGKDDTSESEVQKFLGVERNTAAGLVKKLVKEKVLKAKDTGIYAVDKKELNDNAIPRYVRSRRKSANRVMSELVNNAGDMSVSEREAPKRTLTEVSKSPEKMETEDKDQDDSGRFSRLAKRTKKSTSNSIFFEN